MQDENPLGFQQPTVSSNVCGKGSESSVGPSVAIYENGFTSWEFTSLLSRHLYSWASSLPVTLCFVKLFFLLPPTFFNMSFPCISLVQHLFRVPFEVRFLVGNVEMAIPRALLALDWDLLLSPELRNPPTPIATGFSDPSKASTLHLSSLASSYSLSCT